MLWQELQKKTIGISAVRFDDCRISGCTSQKIERLSPGKMHDILTLFVSGISLSRILRCDYIHCKPLPCLVLKMAPVFGKTILLK